MLFHLYIDDISEIFDDQCHPIKIQETKLRHFLYADDLVILSYTDKGRQTALNNLYAYLGRKCLAVSVKKSNNIIIVAKRSKIFLIDSKPLEPVQSFYLGFDMKASGTVKH